MFAPFNIFTITRIKGPITYNIKNRQNTYCKQVKKVRDKFNSDENIAFYKTLSENDFSNPSEQLTEEIAKATQILNGTTREDGKSWKESGIEQFYYDNSPNFLKINV